MRTDVRCARNERQVNVKTNGGNGSVSSPSSEAVGAVGRSTRVYPIRVRRCAPRIGRLGEGRDEKQVDATPRGAMYVAIATAVPPLLPPDIRVISCAQQSSRPA
jgi:hypothetical protein